MAMSQDTFTRIKAVMDKYGVPATVWYPIAMAESGGNPNAHGDTTLGGTGSWGIFQLYTGGGQGSGYIGAQLTNIELNSEISAKHFAAAYQAIKGEYSDALIAAEVAVRSGHPAGSVSAPYRANTSLYNSIKKWASNAIPFSGSGGSTGNSLEGSIVGAIGDALHDPAQQVAGAGATGNGAMDALQAVGQFASDLSSLSDYLEVNLKTIMLRFGLTVFGATVVLIGIYMMAQSLKA